MASNSKCPRCGSSKFTGQCQICHYRSPAPVQPQAIQVRLASPVATAPAQIGPWSPAPTGLFNFFGDTIEGKILDASETIDDQPGWGKGCLAVVAVGAAGMVFLWNLPWTIGFPALFLLLLLTSFSMRQYSKFSPLAAVLLRDRKGSTCSRMLTVRLKDAPGMPNRDCYVQLMASVKEKALLSRFQDPAWILAYGRWQRTPPGTMPIFIAHKYHALPPQKP